jgi:hypothetical protein
MFRDSSRAGTLIYTFTFPEGDAVLGRAEKWWQEGLAEGWETKSAGERQSSGEATG